MAESSALGAAAYAAAGMGVLANPAEAYQKVKEKETVFLPDKKAHERFQAQFNKYRQLAYAANALDTGHTC